MAPRQAATALGVSMLIGSAAAWAASGVAYRVKDLRTTPTETDYRTADLARVGPRAFLSSWAPGLGAEPYVSNGTTAGTRLLANLIPGSGGSGPASVAELGGTLLFSARTLGQGREMWATDGTAAGTRLVLDIRPGSEGSSPKGYGVLGGIGYFGADDGVHGCELWRSDGTPAGTWMVADLAPGADSGLDCAYAYVSSAALAGRLYFPATDPDHGTELWATDGTAAGTARVADIAPGADGSDPSNLAAAAGRVFFEAFHPARGRELWASDGTGAGTRLVDDLVPGSDSSYATPVGVVPGRVVFSARESGTVYPHLWASDGTLAGTVRLSTADFEVGVAYPFGGRLVYFASDQDGSEPWATDGTPAGTGRLGDLDPGSEGSTLGGAAVGEDGVYFCAWDGSGNVSLWRTDGTPGGTLPIAPLPGCDSVTQGLALPGATLFEITWEKGCGHWECDFWELWRTDGTAAGTHTLWPGPFEISSSGPFSLIARDEGIVFGARTDYASNFVYNRVVESDGTEAGTRPMNFDGTVWSEVAPGMAQLPDGQVALVGDDDTYGSEIWRTDGDRLSVIRDIVPGEGGSGPWQLTRVGDLVFFSTGLDYPWATDGTAAGTILLVDAPPFAGNSEINEFADVFGTAWFGTFVFPGMGELWASDGTPAGTLRYFGVPSPLPQEEVIPVEITPLDPARGSFVFRSLGSLYSFDPVGRVPLRLHDLVAPDLGAGDVLKNLEADVWFFDVDGSGTCALWRSDGTTTGTSEVHEADAWGTCPSELVVFQGELWFPSCDEATGCELWVSDGTEPGTHPFADLEPGPGSFLPSALTPIGDRLYFAGCREATGCEPWVSDGTPAGTHPLGDIAPGLPASDPRDFTLWNRLVFFTADDGTGRELWAAPVEIFYDGFETGDVSRWTVPPAAVGRVPAGAGIP